MKVMVAPRRGGVPQVDEARRCTLKAIDDHRTSGLLSQSGHPQTVAGYIPAMWETAVAPRCGRWVPAWPKATLTAMHVHMVAVGQFQKNLITLRYHAPAESLIEFDFLMVFIWIRISEFPAN